MDPMTSSPSDLNNVEAAKNITSDLKNVEAAKNINVKLPPELIRYIFHLLPFSDLKTALLVCRWF